MRPMCRAVCATVMNSHWAYEQLPAIANDFPDLKVVTQLHAEGEAGTQDYPALAARFDRFVTCHSVISEHLSRHLSGTDRFLEGG